MIFVVDLFQRARPASNCSRLLLSEVVGSPGGRPDTGRLRGFVEGIAEASSAAEGWNPGLNDADCFHTADPTGFLMGYLGDEPIASISVVRYSSAFGFLGFYIVRPDQRGRGFGFRLWQAGMGYLEGCTVGLDGVVAQQGNYARSGFVLAHRNVRYGGGLRVEAPHDERLKPVSPGLLEAVLAYDRSFFAGPREAFLRCWLRPDARAAIAFVEDGTIKGYGVIRACRSGHKIGPLFADGECEADLLFQALAARARGASVFLDPGCRSAGSALQPITCV